MGKLNCLSSETLCLSRSVVFSLQDKAKTENPGTSSSVKSGYQEEFCALKTDYREEYWALKSGFWKDTVH